MENLNLYVHDIILSILRWLIGLSIGCILGLIWAIIGTLKGTTVPFRVVNDFFRAIPIIALIPVVQMNIGINEYGKIGLIAWAVMFPVWITVKNASDKKLESLSLVLKASSKSKYRYFKLYTFPKILGGFLRGVELAIGIAWLALVAAEWVGTYTASFWGGGLGYKLLTGYEQNNWDTVHMAIFIFGLLGIFSAYTWRVIVYFIFQKSKTFNPIAKEINIS